MNRNFQHISLATVISLLVSLPLFARVESQESEDSPVRLTKAARKAMVKKYGQLDAEAYANQLGQRLKTRELGSRESIMWFALHPINKWEEERLNAASNAEIDYSDPVAVRKFARKLNQLDRAAGLNECYNEALRGVHANRRAQKRPYLPLAPLLFERQLSQKGPVLFYPGLAEGADLYFYKGLGGLGVVKKRNDPCHMKIVSGVFKVPGLVESPELIVSDAKFQIQAAPEMGSISPRKRSHQRSGPDFIGDDENSLLLIKAAPKAKIMTAPILEEMPAVVEAMEASSVVMPEGKIENPEAQIKAETTTAGITEKIILAPASQIEATEGIISAPTSVANAVISQSSANESTVEAEQPSMFASLLSWWTSKVAEILS